MRPLSNTRVDQRDARVASNFVDQRLERFLVILLPFLREELDDARSEQLLERPATRKPST
jgi:hypothetical protein